MSKFRKLASWGGQTIIIFLITFVLAEITFRVYNHFNPSFIFYDPSYNRFRGKPGAPDYDFYLNSRGFKDVEFNSEKETNTYRVLALGDSFAFGVVPYRHNYLTLLEQQLNSGGRRIEVLNMGIPDLGPQHYLALLANEGLQLQPDMVLVSFFIGNDFTDTMVAGRTSFYEYSAVAALIKYVIDLNRKYAGRVIHGPASYDDNVPTFTEEAYLSIERDRSLIYMKREPFKKAFADAMGYLVRIKELCNSRKIALRVVIIPDELQVNPVLRAKVLKALNASSDELDFTLPNRFLNEQLRVHGIDHFDLLEDFSSASARMNLYKPNDGHWNIAGNKLAADILASYISNQLSR
jgi:lysophospholipase L1-like esterase